MRAREAAAFTVCEEAQAVWYSTYRIWRRVLKQYGLGKRLDKAYALERAAAADLHNAVLLLCETQRLRRH